jgi:hypothetical protein
VGKGAHSQPEMRGCRNAQQAGKEANLEESLPHSRTGLVMRVDWVPKDRDEGQLRIRAGMAHG